LTVVLLQKFAEAAAKLIPRWEIIDYAHDEKIARRQLSSTRATTRRNKTTWSPTLPSRMLSREVARR
jgi:hypothetical protein